MLGVFLRRNSTVIPSTLTRRSDRWYSSKSALDVFIKKLKLGRFLCFEKKQLTGPYLELLKNNHEDLDVVHVRIRQPQVLFLRTELLLQRISYLEPLGMSTRQKRKLIESSPPVLMLDFDADKKEGGEVSYLRGIVRQKSDVAEEVDKLVHILHPCSQMVAMRAFDLKNQLKVIQEELGMAQQTALRLLLNTPSFLLHNRQQMADNFQLIHKFSLPSGFNLDCHTAELFPPVFNKDLALNRKVFTRDATEALARGLPTLGLNDMLDYSYPEHHGKGQPEDLVEFLNYAERRELRPRYNKVM